MCKTYQNCCSAGYDIPKTTTYTHPNSIIPAAVYIHRETNKANTTLPRSGSRIDRRPSPKPHLAKTDVMRFFRTQAELSRPCPYPNRTLLSASSAWGDTCKSPGVLGMPETFRDNSIPNHLSNEFPPPPVPPLTNPLSSWLLLEVLISSAEYERRSHGTGPGMSSWFCWPRIGGRGG